MAKYRPVKTCFWSDDFISSLSSNAKLLYLYFLTNERTTLCGIYRLSIRYILFETSLLMGEVEEAMKELEAKTIYYNGWIIIKNYKKHQSKSPKIKEGIKREEADIPQEIKDLAYSIDTVSIHIDKPVLILKPIPKLKLKKKLHKKENSHSPDGSLGEKDFNTSLVDEETKQKRKSSAKKKKDLEDFDKFWAAYPRKTAKGGARKAFAKALKKTTIDILMSAVEKQKYQEQWTKDDGTYIPHPATWLNQECWEDEVKGGYSQKESDRDIDWSKVELPIINP